jgi:hypothetical protein
MNKKFAVLMAGLLVLVLTAVNAAGRVEVSAKSSVGTWKLDISKSSYQNMAAPKFEQLVVTVDTPQSLKWSLKGVEADGKSYFSSYDGPTDGKDHRLISNEAASAIAYTRTANSLNWVIKDKSGAVIETAGGQLSPDGNTLILKGITEGPKGKSSFVSVFTRAQ